MKVKSLSRVRLLATPWTAAHQAPPPMGFSRQCTWGRKKSETSEQLSLSTGGGKLAKHDHKVALIPPSVLMMGLRTQCLQVFRTHTRPRPRKTS